jgi:hypothetical protein
LTFPSLFPERIIKIVHFGGFGVHVFCGGGELHGGVWLGVKRVAEKACPSRQIESKFFSLLATFNLLAPIVKTLIPEVRIVLDIFCRPLFIFFHAAHAIIKGSEDGGDDFFFVHGVVWLTVKEYHKPSKPQVFFCFFFFA